MYAHTGAAYFRSILSNPLKGHLKCEDSIQARKHCQASHRSWRSIRRQSKGHLQNSSTALARSVHDHQRSWPCSKNGYDQVLLTQLVTLQYFIAGASRLPRTLLAIQSCGKIIL